MKGFVWLVPADPATHPDLAAEPIFFLAQALSAHVPIWTLSWHPLRVGPCYYTRFWDGRGRSLAFWGEWSLAQLSAEAEAYWKMEGFHPQVVLYHDWGLRLAQRWGRRFGARVVQWGQALAFQLPYSGLGEASPAPFHQSLALPIEPVSVNLALQLIEALAKAGQKILLLGHAPQATPFRNLAHAYPAHIQLALGLTWTEVESLLGGVQAVILPKASPLLAWLSWGRPVAYPDGINWPGAFSYKGVSDLLDKLKEEKPPSPAPLDPAQAALVAWERLSAYF